MKLRIVFSAQADADRDAIWDHTVERWSVDQAEAYLLGIDRVLTLLAEQPTIARERREFDPPVRVHPYKSHLLVFRTSDATLDVIRIVHARSNWTALFPQ